MLEYTSNNLRGNMAQRRMFSIGLLESDSFLELSNDSKVVYFYLAIRSDDDGFSKCPKAIKRMLGLDDMAFQTSLNELEKAQLIYIIDGVFVVRHWNKSNRIQKDRYHSTEFKSILNKLILIDKIYYLRDDSNVDTDCIQHVYNMDTDCILSIDKSSTDKSSVDEERQAEFREGVGTSLNEPQSFKEGTELYQEITPEMIKNIDSRHILNNNDINYLCEYIKTNHIEDYVSYAIKYIKEK